MTTENAISTILVTAGLILNPIVPTTTYFIIAEEAGLFQIPGVTVSPANYFADSIVGDVGWLVWDWTLMNILTPLIIIAFLVLFFVMQYYMIRFYIFLVKNGIPLFKRIATIYQLKRDNILTGLHK